MYDGCQVHDFLYARFGHHTDTRTAHSHNIVMTGENGIAVRSNSSGCCMEYGRQQFPCYFEHVGKHDHHALRRRKSRR